MIKKKKYSDNQVKAGSKVMELEDSSNYSSGSSAVKVFDLEERTRTFALKVFGFVRSTEKNVINNEISKQVVRSAGSVGANYIEANEALGDKDFCMKIRICRKEAKETKYWLSLLDVERCETKFCSTRVSLVKESDELVRIFHSILMNRLAKLKTYGISPRK